MARNRITIDDLHKVQGFFAIRVSPDARHAVVVVRSPNVKEQRNDLTLWLWRAEDDSFESLTSGPADSSPEWLDSKTIVFTASKRDKDEDKANKPFAKSRLYTISVRGGEAVKRAELDGCVWGTQVSPDGRWIALAYSPNPAHTKQQAEVWEKAPRPVYVGHLPYRLDAVGTLPEQYASVYVLSTSGKKWGAPKRVLEAPEYWYGLPQWTPDSKRFVVTRSNATVPFSETEYIISDLNGHAARLTAPKGEPGAHAVSPDGTRLVLCASTPVFEGGAVPVPIYVRSLDPKDTKCRLVAESDGKFGMQDVLSDICIAHGDNRVVWLDNSRVVTMHSEHGVSRLVEVNVDEKGSVRNLATDSGIVHMFDTCGKTTLYAWADPTNPGEVYRLGRARPISKMNRKVAPKFSVKPVSWMTATQKGTNVQAWLWATAKQLESKARASLPLLIYVHGGPTVQAGDTPFHEYAWLAENGFPVVISNPRGSTGYGAGHGTAILGNWGDRDVHDILAVRAAALRKWKQFDPERTFILGGSYGGYMTNMMVTRHPGVFRAGVTMRSICNHVSFDGTGDFPNVFARIACGVKIVWDDPARVWNLSPISKIKRVTEPLLVLHSDNDLRCPLSQADELVAALVATGKKLNEDVRFVIHRNESHGLSRGGRPENRRVRLEEILAWLRKHNNRR